jgi:phosphoglucosamine mutase
LRINDAPGRYIEYCKSTVPSHLHFEGIKVVIDSANGATYHIATNVFRELGATVFAIGCEPNGYNINLNCGSTHPESLRKKVLEEKADLGIALDGDGDRLVMVDHKGEILDGDDVLYIILKFRQSMRSFQGGVVGTLMTNFGLEKSLRDSDIPFVRAQVGDRYVLDMLLKNNWRLGGEQSGHIICLDHSTTGDGIISALQVLSAMQYYNQSLHDLKKGFTKFPQKLVNIPFKKENDPLSRPDVQEYIAQSQAKLGEKGRIIIRKSGTEPLIRIMVEADDESLVHDLIEDLLSMIQG